MNESKEKDSRYTNQSISKALAILDLFGTENFEMKATEIAAEMDTSVGTLFPILHTLEQNQYLHRDDDKKYTLGFKLLERSNILLQSIDLREAAQPILRDLAKTCNCNAHLTVLHGWDVMYLHREEGRPSVTINEIVGRRVPAHCTASGKVLLAHLEESKLERYLRERELEPRTPNTITDPDVFREELNTIREQGYAEENEEFYQGNACIAAPVKNYQGRVVGAVSVSFPPQSSPGPNCKQTTNVVKEKGREVSARLGFQPQQ